MGLDGHATINVWDWRKGKVIATVRGHSDRVRYQCRHMYSWKIENLLYLKYINCLIMLRDDHIGKYWYNSGI